MKFRMKDLDCRSKSPIKEGHISLSDTFPIVSLASLTEVLDLFRL